MESQSVFNFDLWYLIFQELALEEQKAKNTRLIIQWSEECDNSDGLSLPESKLLLLDAYPKEFVTWICALRLLSSALNAAIVAILYDYVDLTKKAFINQVDKIRPALRERIKSNIQKHTRKLIVPPLTDTAATDLVIGCGRLQSLIWIITDLNLDIREQGIITAMNTKAFMQVSKNVHLNTDPDTFRLGCYEQATVFGEKVKRNSRPPAYSVLQPETTLPAGVCAILSIGDCPTLFNRNLQDQNFFLWTVFVYGMGTSGRIPSRNCFAVGLFTTQHS